MYSDGRPHGPDAKCQTCGMTDEELIRIIARSARSAGIAWRLGTSGGIAAALVMIWWTVTGVGSLLHFFVGVYILYGVRHAMKKYTRGEAIVMLVNKSVRKNVCDPCVREQAKFDAAMKVLTDTSVELSNRVEVLRSDHGIEVHVLSGTE